MVADPTPYYKFLHPKSRSFVLGMGVGGLAWLCESCLGCANGTYSG